jgi:hypothetical protein
MIMNFHFNFANRLPANLRRTCITVILLTACMLLQIPGHSQVVNESTKKKISIGVGLFNDFWLSMPEGIKTRTINQGFTILSTYNVPFGKSRFSFAIGLQLSVHNMYGNFYVSSKTDTTRLVKIPDDISYKRSKLKVTYLEVPVEFRYKSKSKVTIAPGFKVGIVIGSSTKYVGNGPLENYNYTVNQSETTTIKFFGVKNLQQITYGPTLRIGYSWVNLNATYMLSTIFKQNKGPQMYPISVGFILMPF